jgi:hypothetical protein
MNTSIKTQKLTEISDNYNKIIENYKSIYSSLKNILQDVKILENVHNVYINSIDMTSLNYSIYVDDIKHQITITEIEYDYINKIYNLNIEKLYRDLFKLYNKLTKIILNIFKENKDTVIKIWNSCEKINGETDEFKKLKKSIRTLSENIRSPVPIINDNKIFEEIKKQYYRNIKIYDELNNTVKYNVEDIINIFNLLLERLNDLNLSKELIKLNLLDIKNKTNKGVIGQTFIMDLKGKSDKINVDYNISIKILESIISIHLSLSDKFKIMAEKIAEQVNYNEDTASQLLSISDTEKNINDIFISNDENN